MIPLSKSKIIGNKSVDKISGYDLSVIKSKEINIETGVVLMHLNIEFMK